jgi:hypothetical protein
MMGRDEAEAYLRARDAAVGEPRAVVLAALYWRGTEEDAEFLADVRRRIEEWEIRQAQAEHAEWIAQIRKDA